MKNKKALRGKKLLAIALCATIIGTMAGCGNSAEEAPKEQDTVQTPETPAAQPSEEAEENSSEEAASTEPEETYDFGGRTFRIGAYYDLTPNPDAGALEAALAERVKYVEDNYNCKIEFVDLGGDYVADYVTSVLAGDPCVDIGYVVTTKLLPSLIEGGIAYPVSQLDTIDLSEYKWKSAVTEAGEYKGGQYAFLVKDPDIRYGIFWNKTLFEKNGLPDLYELAENGEWTWEKFQEIASQGNQDTDNDGTIDIYGFNARENLAWCYLYSNGAYVGEKTDSGIKINLNDPKVEEALTALQNFSQNVDYRDTIDWSVESWDSFIKDFRDGKYMMCLEEFWISYSYLNSEEGGMTDDWGWVPFPKGPSADDWSCYGKESGARFILNGVENPEEVAQVYDLLTDIADSDEEWDEFMEDKLDNWCDDAQTKDWVTYINDSGVMAINGVMGFSDLNDSINEMIGAVTSGEMTPATALETYQSAIDAALADLENHDYNAEMQEYEIEEETASE